MGAITEAFANVTEAMQADYGPVIPGVRRPSPSGIVLNRLLKPLLPAAVRCGTGTIIDIKDRQTGPFDVIAASEVYPALGEGRASLYAADGVIFVLQARDWAAEDLTEFGRVCADLKRLERRRTTPVVCTAVSFEPLPIEQVSDFLKGQAGQSVDGVLTLGQHTVIRNSQGWYGDPQRVPFVSERNGVDALKHFTFFLLQLSQSFLGLPFGFAQYQHL